jgi:hypothetical protein
MWGQLFPYLFDLPPPARYLETPQYHPIGRGYSTPLSGIGEPSKTLKTPGKPNLMRGARRHGCFCAGSREED